VNRSAHLCIGSLFLAFALLASSVAADPILIVYPSAEALAATLPPGSEPQDFIIAMAEFGDTTDFPEDFGLTYSGNGAIVEVTDPVCCGSEFFWNTTGPISFILNAGSANAFVISYLALPPGQTLPTVSVMLTDGTTWDVGPLVGGPFEHPGELFFAFTSNEAFTMVSLNLDATAPLQTQFAGFANVPSPASVPEPGTLLLLSTGVLASARHLTRSRKR
jgi:hypothetical protein